MRARNTPRMEDVADLPPLEGETGAAAPEDEVGFLRHEVLILDCGLDGVQKVIVLERLVDGDMCEYMVRKLDGTEERVGFDRLSAVPVEPPRMSAAAIAAAVDSGDAAALVMWVMSITMTPLAKNGSGKDLADDVKMFCAQQFVLGCQATHTHIYMCVYMRTYIYT